MYQSSLITNQDHFLATAVSPLSRCQEIYVRALAPRFRILETSAPVVVPVPAQPPDLSVLCSGLLFDQVVRRPRESKVW